MASFCGWGSTTSKLEPLRGGNLLFITKKSLVLILSTSEGRKAWSNLGPPCGFDHRTRGLVIQPLCATESYSDCIKEKKSVLRNI